MPGDPNETIIEAWNTVLFEKFARFRWVLTEGLSAHSDTLFAGRPYPAGARVLDVGCGFGDTTRQIAAQVGPEGEAVGCDCAQRFVDAAQEAEEGNGTAARFFAADAQTGDLGGPYDAVFSRFGTMFFDLPGAAMRNIRRALSPGGELTMIVWRRREDNPWLHAAELCVKELLPVRTPEETGAVHCGPGPFSMAGPDLVSDLLQGAGYEQVSFERHDADICIGRSVDEALEFAMALGPAGEVMRLAGDEGEQRRDEVCDALRDTLGRFLRDDGTVWAPSSVWYVRGTAAA